MNFDELIACAKQVARTYGNSTHPVLISSNDPEYVSGFIFKIISEDKKSIYGYGIGQIKANGETIHNIVKKWEINALNVYEGVTF